MPEFEGGLKALYRFLRKTLRYPSVAQRMAKKELFMLDLLLM